MVLVIIDWRAVTAASKELKGNKGKEKRKALREWGEVKRKKKNSKKKENEKKERKEGKEKAKSRNNGIHGHGAFVAIHWTCWDLMASWSITSRNNNTPSSSGKKTGHRRIVKEGRSGGQPHDNPFPPLAQTPTVESSRT